MLPLTFNLTLPIHNPSFLAVPFKPSLKPSVCFAFSPSEHNPIGDEARWLREEQRWLREEQRWLREESRGNAERQALLQEISRLELRVQELERLNSLQGASASEIVANIGKLLPVLKDGDFGKSIGRISDHTSSVSSAVEADQKEDEVVIKEVVSVSDKKQTVRRVALRMGSEGEEVHEMQEALQKLGFYSGEEDIEFSSFSSGTERAVKTWQATIGAPQDGIMTEELLEILHGNPKSDLAETQEQKLTDLDKDANGASDAAIRNVPEVQQTVVKDKDISDYGVTENRVYLLGENRWEEPSRLSGGKKTLTKSKDGNTAAKCITCRGEGRLLCMECEGTGEPNIEPQFLEWVGQGANCPYCDGLGYIPCDVCGGRM